MGAVMTKGRSLLGAGTLDDAVFNTINLPEIHEINFEAIVRSGARTAAARLPL